MEQRFVPKKVAPLQYTLRRLNSEAGRVNPGWGTAPVMGALLVALLLFIIIILQVYNGTILLEGVNFNTTDLGF
ncbi:photosystem II reaction center protein PsbH [Oscillatoria sp. CS-180]|uniref:photosystem II reaction center phosphoprotein PsbH n=1 Tax=Oscillatoria sp. CS-180 TaxID=3021720 RepID=UPI00232FA41F|nr:photosystem II reaction center protein PsbH [Oscillatoria sp. CS-180]MDB9526403.1 photosystem II reaction center protein PsbH [Oscillatoria sp. CS-180]